MKNVTRRLTINFFFQKTKFGEFFAGEKLSSQFNFLIQLLKENNGGSGFMVGDKVLYRGCQAKDPSVIVVINILVARLFIA